MNKKQFLESLNEVYCRLAPTKHGVGVIAIRNIPKGVDPFKNCDPDDRAVTFTEKELKAAKAPEEAKRLVRDFCALQNGVYYAPAYHIDQIDKSFFLNHSKKPNMTTLDHGESFRTARIVKKGEELTIDYGMYNETKEFKR